MKAALCFQANLHLRFGSRLIYTVFALSKGSVCVSLEKGECADVSTFCPVQVK